jgi:hypothetical protein
LNKYVFILWDGLKFFDFAFDKLPRLRGHNASFLDKLQDRKKIASVILLILITIWVIVAEFSDLGKLKAQEVKLEDKQFFNVSSNESLELVSIVDFEAEEILNRFK